MTKKKIAYGIIGVGHLGNFHTEQALKNENFNVRGVYDLNEIRGAEISKKYNVDYFSDINQLLNKCNAVSIVTPASTHYEIALKALENNCHTFIEKPFCTNIKHAHEIQKTAEEKNLLVQIGHIEQFNPVFKKFISFNPKPVFLESERLAPFNKRGIDVDVILDLMIHDIDLILSLVPTKIKNISANGVQILSNSYDLVNARLEFQNNVTANLTASRLSIQPMRKLRVFESSVYSSLDLNSLSIARYTVNQSSKNHNANVVFELDDKSVSRKTVSVNAINALYEELDSFSQSIINRKPIIVDAKKGIQTLEIAFEIQKKLNEN